MNGQKITRPEALRLADVLDYEGDSWWDAQAAAELRRLHEVNGHLLLALEKLARLGNEPFYGNSIGNQIAQDAIAKATGDKP